MGYYTDFTLKIEGPESAIETLSNSSELGEMDYGHLLECFYHQKDNFYYWRDTKWYEWEEDMLSISEKNPDLFFTLWGDGEESDDHWVAYFSQGKHEKFKAKLTFPETTLR